MGLFEQWNKLAEMEKTQDEYDTFWNNYLEREKAIYEHILRNHTEPVSGKIKTLAEQFEMNTVEFAGFLDGINTSLVKALALDELTDDSEIKLDIDYEKLYYNMLNARAYWLYNLPEWDAVLAKERRSEITRDFNRSRIAVSNKIGRNDACPCGSGKKYKKCCGK